MLPKFKRLNLKKDFNWIANGKLVDTTFAKLYYRFGTNDLPRIGITAPSGVFKKAHSRNRARRLISSLFEVIYTRLPTRLNILAIPKPHLIEVKSDDLLLSLEDKLKEVGLIK